MRPRLDTWSDFGTNYEGWPRFLQFQDSVNAEGCEAFRTAHLDLPLTERNSQALIDFCNGEQVPMTRRNLEIAWRELESEGKLEANAVEEAVGTVVRSEIKIRAVHGRLAAAEPSATEAAELETLKDDPTLNDQSRKKRHAKLRGLAHQQRRVRRDHTGVTHV